MARNPGRTGRPWRRVRAAVLESNDVCWLCGTPGADSVDHVIPLSKGGPELDPANLRPAHGRCNSARKDTLGPPKRQRAGSRQW